MMKQGLLLIKGAVWIPVIIMAFTIFGFSTQNGEESQGISYVAADRILGICKRMGIVDYNERNREEMIEHLQFPIRKCAHMMEYAVFTVFIYIALRVDMMNGAYQNTAPVLSGRQQKTAPERDRRHRIIIFASFAAAVIFACTDEIHQLFVPGRSGQFTDVCIDAAGCAIGLLIAVLAGSVAGNLKRRYAKS